MEPRARAKLRAFCMFTAVALGLRWSATFKCELSFSRALRHTHTHKRAAAAVCVERFGRAVMSYFRALAAPRSCSWLNTHTHTHTNRARWQLSALLAAYLSHTNTHTHTHRESGFLSEAGEQEGERNERGLEKQAAVDWQKKTHTRTEVGLSPTCYGPTGGCRGGCKRRERESMRNTGWERLHFISLPLTHTPHGSATVSVAHAQPRENSRL